MIAPSSQGWETVRERVLTAAHVLDTLHRSSTASREGRRAATLEPMDVWFEHGTIPSSEFYNKALGWVVEAVLRSLPRRSVLSLHW